MHYTLVDLMGAEIKERAAADDGINLKTMTYVGFWPSFIS